MNISQKNTAQMKYFYPNNPSNNIALSDFNSIMNPSMKHSPASPNQNNYKNNQQRHLKNVGFGLQPIQQLAYPKYIEGDKKNKQLNSPKTTLTYQKKQQLKAKLSLKNQLDLIHAPNDRRVNKIKLGNDPGSPKATKKPEKKVNLNAPSFQYENIYYPKNFAQNTQFYYPQQQITSQRCLKKSFISSPTSDNERANIYLKNLPVVHAPQYYPISKQSLIFPQNQNVQHIKRSNQINQQQLPKQSFINPEQTFLKKMNAYEQIMSAQSQARNINEIPYPINKYFNNKNHCGSANNLHFYSSSELNIEDYRNQHKNYFIPRQNAMINPVRHDKMKTSMIEQPSTHFQNNNKHSNSLSLQKDNQYQCRIPNHNSFSNLPDFLSNKQSDRANESKQTYSNGLKIGTYQKSNNSSYQQNQLFNNKKDLFSNVSKNSPRMVNNKIEMNHFQGHKMNTFSALNGFLNEKKQQIAKKNLNQAQFDNAFKDNAHKKKSLKHKNLIAGQKKKALALLKEQYSQSRKNSPSINFSNSPPSSIDKIPHFQIQDKNSNQFSNRKPRKNSYQWKSDLTPKIKQHKQSWQIQSNYHQNQDQKVYYNNNVQLSFAKKPNKAVNGVPIQTPEIWQQKKKSIRFSEPPSIVLGFQFNQNKNSKEVKGKLVSLPQNRLKQTKILNQSIETKESSYYYRIPKYSDFHIGKQLGRGKFGVVNKALHKKTGFLFALKTLSKKSIQKEKVYDQIIREVKIQYFMNHPHLVKLYGIFDDRDNIYLLLEYCTDGQLYQILQHKTKFSELDACIIMKQLCQGVAQLHRNNVIHRDMKPQNVVVNFGMCKICDFGWSIYSQNKQSLRQTLCGTPLYFSPELITQGSYNQKVDLWALGMMAFELINGDIPFDIKSQSQLYKIATSQIVYPPSMSLEVIEFIKLLLQRNPEKRINIDKVLKHKFFDTYHKQSQSARSRSAAKLMNYK